MKSKPYFNNLQGLYQGCQPPFYAAGEIEGVALLESHWETIRDELAENLADAARAAVCFEKKTLKKMAGWRQIELKIYGVEYPARIQLFPRTMAILSQIPGISTIYFSLLAPQSDIAAHVGDTDAYYRMHLGLKIPTGLPDCGIEVAGQQAAWQEGRCIAFNDVYYHSVWNRTDQERIVLIIDIMRPEFRKYAVFVDSGVRATLYHSRLYAVFSPIVELLPRILTRMGLPVFHLFSYVYHSARLRRRQKRTGAINHER